MVVTAIFVAMHSPLSCSTYIDSDILCCVIQKSVELW